MKLPTDDEQEILPPGKSTVDKIWDLIVVVGVIAIIASFIITG